MIAEAKAEVTEEVEDGKEEEDDEEAENALVSVTQDVSFCGVLERGLEIWYRCV